MLLRLPVGFVLNLYLVFLIYKKSYWEYWVYAASGALEPLDRMQPLLYESVLSDTVLRLQATYVAPRRFVGKDQSVMGAACLASPGLCLLAYSTSPGDPWFLLQVAEAPQHTS